VHAWQRWWRQARTKGRREQIIAGLVALCEAVRFAISDKKQEASGDGSGQFAQKMRKAALAVSSATAVAFSQFYGFRRQFLARSAIPQMIRYSPASLQSHPWPSEKQMQHFAEAVHSPVKGRLSRA
jgi:hypothetical protein